MPRADRSEPMPVKYWSSAGLLLTYWCNARCSNCYLSCGPEHKKWMSVDFALTVWRQLIQASPHGCRVHITGGEPFGNWPLLIELARRAKAEGLGPLHKVETNAFWATDDELARQRLAQLDEAGMEKLTISTDPYHQQFVPIERCRLLAAAAEQVLGGQRVQVRWRDWLNEGFDTNSMPDRDREELLAKYVAGGRDRLNGRAAELLADHLPQKPPASFADESCREQLLRCKHVHVGPEGLAMPGTCAGIVLGRIGPHSIGQIWRELYTDHAERPVVGILSCNGPGGLMRAARAEGYAPRAAYAGKCQLCWDVRRYLARKGLHDAELAPRWMYQSC